MSAFARDGMPANLPGADWPSRYIGGTSSSSPASGPYAVGDFDVDQTGAIWVCTVAGSPGTWVQVGSLLAGFHQLANIATPAAPTGATRLYAASGQPAYINPAGFAQNLSGSNLATVGGTTVTSAGFTTIASGTVDANDAEIGAIYKLSMFGHGTWGSTQQSLSMQLQIGGSTIGSTQVVDSTVFAVSAAFRWGCDCYLVNVTTGLSGTWIAHFDFTATQTANNVIPGTPANNTVPVQSGTSSAKTADSTINESFAYQVKWAATTGAPTITQDAQWFGRVA